MNEILKPGQRASIAISVLAAENSMWGTRAATVGGHCAVDMKAILVRSMMPACIWIAIDLLRSPSVTDSVQAESGRGHGRSMLKRGARTIKPD